MNLKTCIVVAGPTAVGKTSLAIEIARHFHTEIISADSRQCFKELRIGVARPSGQELHQVKHYFIASHSIHDVMNAAIFEQYALQVAAEIFLQHDVVVMTGGTGLYLKAFCEGMDDMPPVSPEIRQSINLQYEQQGLSWLQQQVQEQDPLYYATGEILNPQRLIRALEVKQATGKSIRTWQEGKKATRDFNIIKIGLQLPKEALHSNIDFRTDNMIKEGLVGEVKSLAPWQHLNALQTVGYSEIFDFLDNKISLEEAIVEIKKHTRQYAKRQMTWFQKDTAIKWFSPSQKDKIITRISSSLPAANR